jgi:thymidylate kinase
MLDPAPPTRFESVDYDPLPPAVRAAFARLQAREIPHVLLRGYTPVSELAESLDIDVFIPAHALERATPALEEAGWRRRKVQTGRFPHVFFDNWESASGVVRSIDVVTSLCFGRDLYRLRDDERIIESSVADHGVCVPAPWIAAFCFALHVLLDKRGLSVANRQRGRSLRERCERDPSSAAMLSEHFGADAESLTRDFLDSLDGDDTHDMRALIVRAERLPTLRGQPVRAFWHRAGVRWRQLRRPVGRVAIFGVDGSGKSTLVQMATERSGTMRIHNGYLGNNAYRTPPAKWLTKTIGRELAAPTRSELRLRILVNLETFWRPFELFARMMIAEHRAELVLYDRFPIGQDDGNPTTRWGRLVFRYTRLSRALLPVPDLVILLDGDDRIIWSRKQEMPFEAHVRTQTRYRALVEQLTAEHATVRTDGSLAESFERLRLAMASSRSLQDKLYGACRR